MKKLFLLISLAIFLINGNMLYAVSDAELKGIAVRIADGTASAKDKALAFKHNKEINNLAMNGQLSGDQKINNEIYQKNQRSFDQTNNEIAGNAAKKNGFNTGGKARDSFKAGTDTDIQLDNPKEKKLTTEDVVKTRNDYNKEVDNYLKKNGVETSGNENWAKKTETDIMPNPDQMAPGEFQKSADYINKDGGNMYRNKGAAGTQLKIDSKQNVSIDEGPAYNRELQEKVKHMKDEKAELQKELKKTTDPEKRAHLETEIKKCESHESKYLDRINKLDKATRDSYGINKTENKPLSPGEQAVKDAQNRDFSAGPDGKMSKSEKAAHAVDSMSDHLRNKALENYNDTVAEVGRCPERTAQSQQIIAENIKNLPPAQQGEAISRLESKFGKDYAKGVAESVRASRAASSSKTVAPDADSALGKKMTKGAGAAVALGLITAGLNSYNEEIEAARAEKRDPSYGKMLENTAYNATVGGYVGAAKNTYKAVTTDTAEYRKLLEEEYRKSGADMNSSATKMKIWGQATAYGTGLGVWQGAHVIPLVGDVIGAAETVTSLSGDALNTLNEIEAQEANVKVQGENEHLIALQAVRKAEKMVSSMETIEAQVKMLKAELAKNSQWVKNISMKYNSWKPEMDKKLKEYQKNLEAVAEMKNSNSKSGLFTNDYSAQSAQELGLIKNTAVNHGKSSDALLKKCQGQPLKPDDRKLIENIIAEFKQNSERFQKKIGEMKYLAEMSQNSDMSRYFQAFGGSLKEELKSAQSVVADSSVASKNIETLAKQIGDASKNVTKLKAGFKRGEAYFAKKDEATKDKWVELSARVAAVKDIDFNAPAYGADIDSVKKFAEDAGNFSKSAKVQEPGDLSWLDNAAKTAAKTIETLRSPMDEAGSELNKASSKVTFLAGLLNLTGSTVKVAVKDAASAAALKGATVTVTFGSDKKTALTDSNGLAVFTDLQNGDANISATADGYAAGAASLKTDSTSKQEYSANIALKKDQSVLPKDDKPVKDFAVSKDASANMSWNRILWTSIPLRKDRLPADMKDMKMPDEMCGFKWDASNTRWIKQIEAGTFYDNNVKRKDEYSYSVILSPGADFPAVAPTKNNDKEKASAYLASIPKDANPQRITTGDSDIIVSIDRNGSVACIGFVYPFSASLSLKVEGSCYTNPAVRDRLPKWRDESVKNAVAIIQQATGKIKSWSLQRVGRGPGIKGWFYPFTFADFELLQTDLPSTLKITNNPKPTCNFYAIQDLKVTNSETSASYMVRMEVVPPAQDDKTADACILDARKKVDSTMEVSLRFYKTNNIKFSGPEEIKIKDADYALYAKADQENGGKDFLIFHKSNIYFTISCEWTSYVRGKKFNYKTATKDLADKVLEKTRTLPNYCP